MTAYYCVNQKYYDSGKVKITCCSFQAESLPAGYMVETPSYDNYFDYFDNLKEASEFAKEARNQ